MSRRRPRNPDELLGPWIKAFLIDDTNVQPLLYGHGQDSASSAADLLV